MIPSIDSCVEVEWVTAVKGDKIISLVLSSPFYRYLEITASIKYKTGIERTRFLLGEGIARIYVAVLMLSLSHMRIFFL